MTEDEARALAIRLVGPGQEMVLHPFEYGWLVQPILPDRRTADGMPDGAQIGLASLIVDQSGVVTVQTSLPVPVVIAEYSEARRQGEIIGHQIWPEENTRT